MILNVCLAVDHHMHIDSRATIEGVPLTVIRTLFRRAGLEGWRAHSRLDLSVTFFVCPNRRQEPCSGR